VTTHDLKIWPKWFADILSYDKNFEVRLNDRGFKVGDELLLREWDPEKRDYTGRVIRRRVTYVSRIDQVIGKSGFVAMQLGNVDLPPAFGRRR
jgi:Domain of unknown function (DUF3850)